MSDLFYKAVRFFGSYPFLLSSRPLVINLEQTRRAGAFLLAPTHASLFDTLVLVRHSYRKIDFLSIVEVFRKPFLGWFCGLMNAFPLNRSRPDPATVRIIMDRLAGGRCVGIFPEGRLQRGAKSVVYTRQLNRGLGRIAKMASVPIVPCVVIGAEDYQHVHAWFPIRRTRYGIIFGEAIEPDEEDRKTDQRVADAMAELHRQLSTRLGRSI